MTDAALLRTILEVNQSTPQNRLLPPLAGGSAQSIPKLLAMPNVCIHLDGNAPKKFGKGYSGLLFSTWVDDATLDQGISRLRQLGVAVINPHTWLVGSHGGLEHYQTASTHNDPHKLLNPGKLPVPSH